MRFIFRIKHTNERRSRAKLINKSELVTFVFRVTVLKSQQCPYFESDLDKKIAECVKDSELTDDEN